MRRRFILSAGAAGVLALLIAVIGAAGAFAWGGVNQGGPATSLTPSTTTAAYPTTGNGGGFCGGYGNGAGVNGSMGNNLLQAAAEVLGVNAQDVQNGIQNGQTIAQQAKAKGIDTAKIIDSFKAKEQQRLNGLVSSGSLTQQQADAILDMHVDMAQLMIDNGLFGGMMGSGANGFGGYGMMGGNGYGMMGGWGNGSPSSGNGNGNTTIYGPGMMGYWN
jgi:hypothetical protein